MNYNVIPVDKFKKEAKRLIKKYLSLKEELTTLATTLTANPEAGTPLGNNTYKIRKQHIQNKDSYQKQG